MSIYYLLFQNIGGGYARIYPSDNVQRGPHEDFVADFDTLAEAEAAMEELRGPTVWAVFWNNGAADGYVSAEDDLSGNWRGSRDGHYTCVSCSDTQEEAEKYLTGLYNA